MYPNFFKTPSSFNTDTEDFVLFENERVKEMLDIVRRKTGKKFVVFIIDEVGQYIGSRPNLILNIDGLAKNLRALGEGNVWIIATAQQTLTEDDPRAAINSPELFKLQARFPFRLTLNRAISRKFAIAGFWRSRLMVRGCLEAFLTNMANPCVTISN